MKRHVPIIVIAGLTMTLTIRCVDRSTGPGDGGTSGVLDENAGSLDSHTGNNAVVKDSATASEVGSSVQSQSIAAAGKAMSLMSMSKIKFGGGLNGSIDGTINGTSSGTATAKGSYTYSVTSGAVTYDITCTFNNYSDDGKLFLGGQIHYLIDYALVGTTPTGTYTITGKVRFNGAYEGSCDFDYDYNLTNGSFSYSSTVTSDEFTTSTSISYP